MAEVIFADPSTVNQRGEFTVSSLEPEEQQMIDDLVNWRDPQQYQPLIFQVYGRSLVLRSPIKPQGPYRGLQLIGAGGSLGSVMTGILPSGTKLEVNPVNPANHASRLEDILQIFHIDDTGQVQSSLRSYAPLHGMDQAEAEARAVMTNQTYDYLERNEQAKKPLPFCTSKLVADGQLIGKNDPLGQPLRFQVYRVPLIPRFPGQMTNTGLEEGIEEALKDLQYGSFLAGRTLKILNNSGLAYMDGHAGNMSILASADRDRLFITDLGSIRIFRGSPYPARYRGFDVHMYLESMRRFLLPYFDFLTERGKFEGQRREQANQHIEFAVYGLTEGYFLADLCQAREQRGLSDEDYQRLIIGRSRQLLQGFLRYYDHHQKFLEFFEGFYREFQAV